jgi:putative transposase
MARPLRVEYPGAWYHVMNRGLCRREVFHTEDFAQIFYDLLEEAHQRFQIEVHAFCLMGNHYHLCIRTPHANLGRAMQYVNSGFTQKYNYIVKGDGPIFKGRYRAIIIQAKKYFLNVSRYIHLNPVSAGMIEHPKDYQWSSYKFLMGKQDKPSWLYLNETFKCFENQNPILGYENFVLDGVDSELKSFFSKKKVFPILGDNEFIKTIENKIKKHMQDEIPEINRVIHHPAARIVDIISIVANYYNITPATVCFSNPLEDKPRKIAIYLAVQMSGKSHAQIGMCFNEISYHWVSKIYLNMKTKIKEDASLSMDVSNIKKLMLTLTLEI